MKEWLLRHYQVHFEYPVNERRRLDAAIWTKTDGDNQRQRPMDIALEWEWDNNALASDFPCGDFRKCLDVDAKCGLVIMQTRVDGNRGSTQADDTVSSLLVNCKA